MRNYCALGDTRYLPHLMCLIDSVRSNFTEEYKLHILALDDNVREKISKLRSGNDLVIYSINQVNEDFQIRSIRYSPPSREAISNAHASNKDPGFVQFCWALASCFTHWLMDRIKSSITYIDADIYFFNDIKPFYKELGDKSIGLVRHRIPYLMSSGEFNVGIVHFEFDKFGRAALSKWKSFLVNGQNNYALCFGTCGDQKYLEVIYGIFRDNVAIVDEKFGHLAPWNVTQHKYEDGKILWEDKRQELCYFHFAHFVIESDTSYRASYNNEWIWGDPLKVDSFVNDCYHAYFLSMVNVKKEIEKCD